MSRHLYANRLRSPTSGVIHGGYTGRSINRCATRPRKEPHLTENDLRQLEETLSKDVSPGARQIRDLIDQVRGLKVLIRQAKQEKQDPMPRPRDELPPFDSMGLEGG